MRMMDAAGTWTEWQECRACDGLDCSCFTCEGEGGASVRLAKCGYCQGDAEVFGDDPDPMCSDCAWEMC